MGITLARIRDFGEAMARCAAILQRRDRRKNSEILTKTMNASPRHLLSVLALVLLALAICYAIRHADVPAATPKARIGRIGPPDIYPIPSITPGAINPEITQENIHETICSPNWSTKSERPPSNYTNRLKREGFEEYNDTDRDMRDYEEDHLIPLEIGGNPTDPKNLWPEPFQTSIPDGGAHDKDKVENYLHEQICRNGMNLAEAQKAIATDWYQIYVDKIKFR
jgi:hypothetical protein